MPKLPKYTFDEDVNLTGNVTSARGAVRGAMVSAGEAGNIRSPQLSAPQFKPMILNPPFDDISGKSMEGLVHFSETIRDVAFKLQERQDKLVVRKALLETDEALGGIDLEFSSTFGQESVEAYPGHKKSVEEVFAAKASELTPRQRELFLSDGGTSLRQHYQRRGAGHFAKQVENAEAQTFLIEVNDVIGRVAQGEDVFSPDSEGISPYDRLMSRQKKEDKRIKASNAILQDAAAIIAAESDKGHVGAVEYLQKIRESRPDIVRRDPSHFATTEKFHKTQAKVEFNARKTSEEKEMKANWAGAVALVPSAIPDSLLRGDDGLNTALANVIGLGIGSGATDTIKDVSEGVSSGLMSLQGKLKLKNSYDPHTETLNLANAALSKLSGPPRTAFEAGIRGYIAEQASMVTKSETIAGADLATSKRLEEENKLIAYTNFVTAFKQLPKNKHPDLLNALKTENPGAYNKYKDEITSMMNGTMPSGLTTTPERDLATFYGSYPAYVGNPDALIRDFGGSDKFPEMYRVVEQDRKGSLAALKKSAHDSISAMFGSKKDTAMMGPRFGPSDLKENMGLNNAFEFYSTTVDNLVQREKMTPQEAHDTALTKLLQNKTLMASAPFMDGKVPKFENVMQVYRRGTQTFTLQGDRKAGTEDLFEAISSRFTGQFAKYKYPEGGADVGDDAALKSLTGAMLSKLEEVVGILRRDGDIPGVEAAYREYQIIQAQASFIQQYPDSVLEYLERGMKKASGSEDNPLGKPAGVPGKNTRASTLK